jgi:long-chain acyl-CoA synthetase
MRYLWQIDAEFARAEKHTAPPLAGDTVQALFWNAVAARKNDVWLRQKELGIWHAWTWHETGEIVKEIAMGLHALGMQVQDRVSILANTRAEWLWADLAILSLGGTSAGIYPTDAASQVHYILSDSESRFLFVEDEEQLDKVLEVLPDLPHLIKIIVLDNKGLRHFEHPQVLSLEALRQLGAKTMALDPHCLDTLREASTPEHLAILVYTSGTTGKPKGAMHHHAGLVYAIRGHTQIIAQTPQDERMCFLPLCHIAERVGGAFVCMYTGTKINFVENPETVPENIREISPTIILAVPRVWEKFQSGVYLSLKESTKFEQLMFHWAIELGTNIADQFLDGRPIALHQRLAYRVAQWLVLANVRKSLGIDKARFLLSGAAPISPKILRWFFALGVPMFEIWGMTETCGGSCANYPGFIKIGSIGVPSPHNEMKLDPETGEILIRGPNIFSGYLNLPEKTKEVFDSEGWMHTGDVGTMDAQGFFSITDRMKDIIITAGGKNITPSELENELKASPYITDAVIVGDRLPYLTAIIMVDHDNVEQYAQSHDIGFTNYESMTQAAEISELIQSEVDQVNQKFARVEQIKKFFLLSKKLSPEDEEVTPTMKLKRKLVIEKYSGLIQKMYSESA